MENRKFGAITSSQNPEEIATKVKGIVLLFSSLVILLASRIFHVHLTPDDVGGIATELGVFSGAICTVYGVGLHLLSYFFKTE